MHWGNGMFASRFPSSQLSKNASFPTVEKRLVLHYTSVAKNRDENAEMAEKMGLGEEK